MFSWFLKKKKTSGSELHSGSSDWSFLATDIHSHLIPGIDDGAQTMEDSIAMIRALKDMGFSSIVTTPHIKFDHFPNTTETIQNGLRELHLALKDNRIDIPVRAAAEYYIDDH